MLILPQCDAPGQVMPVLSLDVDQYTTEFTPFNQTVHSPKRPQPHKPLKMPKNGKLSGNLKCDATEADLRLLSQTPIDEIVELTTDFTRNSILKQH